MKKEKQEFSKKLAKEIAMKSFGYTLDCVLGYTKDDSYSLTTDAKEFDQNYEEDLEEYGITVTERRIKIIQEEYDRYRDQLIKSIRKKYYDKNE